MNKLSRLKKAFIDVTNDPATFIALGSVFMSAAMGGIEGAYLNALATSLIAALKGFESWTGQSKGKPFGLLAGINIATAASIGYHALKQHGISVEIIPQASITAAYALWGVRSGLLSLQERFKIEINDFKNDPQFYQGLGALATTQLQPLASAFSIAGITRTFFNKRLKKLEQASPEYNGFLKHFTAARAYAAQ